MPEELGFDALQCAECHEKYALGGTHVCVPDTSQPGGAESVEGPELEFWRFEISRPEHGTVCGALPVLRALLRAQGMFIVGEEEMRVLEAMGNVWLTTLHEMLAMWPPDWAPTEAFRAELARRAAKKETA